MPQDSDDLGDARSRADQRRYLENARRTATLPLFNRWLPIHRYRASPGDMLMAVVGAVMLVAAVVFF